MSTRTPDEGGSGPKCRECLKPARYLISQGLACGTHAYEYLMLDEGGSGPMPAQIRSLSSKHQRNLLRRR
ncbi:MAG: hypothetical protein WED83_05770 [Acidimicrobiia bacterium]